MFSYTAYGLCIHSDLSLPHLRAVEGAPDVVVRLAKCAELPLGDDGRKTFVRITDEEVLFSQENVGACRVRAGHEIVAYPMEGADEQVLAIRLVQGPAFNVLLHQRGLLVLHASAVSVNGSAVAFIGGPGAGKSTTAAVLYTRGYPLVADDIVPVQIGSGIPTVFPAFPGIKLHPGVTDYMGFESEESPRRNVWLEKHTVCATQGFSQTPLPLKCIYLLFEGGTQGIELLPPSRSFLELLRHSGIHLRSGFRILKETGTLSSHFHQCSKLASCIPVYRLERGNSLSALSDLGELVEAHLTDDTGSHTVFTPPTYDPN
jgi:hypothetical protein